MITIVFNYGQLITTIQANISDPFQIPLNQFAQKTLIPLNSVNFIANGIPIKPEQTVESQMSNLNKKDKKMAVLVDPVYISNKNEVKIQSNDIICPVCKESCRIKIEDYHIKLFKCINGHITSGIRIDDFNKTQEINISSIICGQCKIKNKGNTTNHDFYKCLNCKIDLCILCKTNHDSNHNIIKYDEKNYICPKHNEIYIKYCEECNINICFTCEIEHNKHKTLSLVDFRPDIEKTRKRLLEIKKEVEEFSKQIKSIITKLNSLIRSMNIFYDLNNNIINNYNIKNRNYEIFQNINEINSNNIIYEKLKNINNNKDINTKISNIIELYNNINDNTKIKQEISNKNNNQQEIFNNNQPINEQINDDEINIIYNTNNQDKIKIFGQTFVSNNKNKVKILINEKKYDISEYITLNSEQKRNKLFKIKLLGIKNVTSMGYMFNGCSSLNNFHASYFP